MLMKYYTNSIKLLFLSYLIFNPTISNSAEVVMSLPYGFEDKSIALYIPPTNVEDAGVPAGPSTYYVDKIHNVFYISDNDAVIKKFSLSGQYLGKVQLSDVEAMRSFSLDADGNFYIVHGTAGEYISKIDPSGKSIWKQSLLQIVKGDSSYESIGNLTLDAKNFIYLEAFSSRGIDYIKLNNDGTFLQEVPSNYLDGGGNYFVFTPQYLLGNLFIEDAQNQGYYKFGFDIDVVDPKTGGNKLYKIQFPDDYLKSNYLRDTLEIQVDSLGNAYFLSFVMRNASNNTKLNNGLIINSDNLIYIYNQKGKLLSKFSFPTEPIMSLNRRFQLDNESNIFYLNFGEDKLELLKVKPTILFVNTNINSSGAYFIDGYNRESISSNLYYDAVNKVTTGSLKLMAITISGRSTIQTTAINELTISIDGTVNIKGKCSVNTTTGYTFEASIKDIANPGAGKDLFSIKITGPNNYNVEFANKTIAGGDIAVSWQ